METTETSLLILNLGVRFEQIGNAERQLKADSLSLWMPVSRSRRPGEMAGVHKNTKGIAMPEFQVSYEIARYLSSEPLRNCRSRILQSHAGLLAAGPPKRGNSSPRQCHGRRQPRSWEVVFKTERQKTPPVEILFRNMTSSAIVSETRNSL